MGLFLRLHFSSIQLLIMLSCFLYPQQTTSMHKKSNFTDLESLLSFKATVSDSCGSLTRSWTTNTSFCSWVGVSCSRRHHQRVVSLQLSNSCLQGTISPHLGNLSFMSLLDISRNSLTGSIPVSLAWMPRLRKLFLDNNRLSGLPPALFNMSSLVIFRASFNNLTGTLPSNDTPAPPFFLPRIQCISLGGNRLTGTIPSIFTTCSDLRLLSLWGNEFTGTIRAELGSLPQLTYLYLDHNTLTGSIPDTLARLPRLRELKLEDNQLSGVIPPSLFNMSSLVILYIDNNYLMGTLPSNDTIAPFFLPRIQSISLSGNLLSGAIPSGFTSCSDLRQLALAENKFTGTIMAELGSLPQLTALILGYNALTGSIPVTLGNATRFTKLDLDVNKLEGKIPESLGNLISLQILSMGGNFLTGSIPTSLLNLSSLNVLELGVNNLTGALPAMLGKAMPYLEFLNLDYLQLNVENNFFLHLSNCRNLRSLRIKGNKLDGSLPTSIGNLSANLEYFFAAGSHISGEIPPEIGNLSGLIELDLLQNDITGAIPWTIARLHSLQGLALNENKMTGPIPSEICSLRDLNALLLYNNALSGPIPSCLGNISGLQYLLIYKNRLSSSVPQSMWILSVLLELDLQGNSLEGSIPEEIGNLKSLSFIGLSDNMLSGNLPNALGELQMLTILDISDNFIQGQIPLSLSELVNIEYLNLSHNSITGAIPKFFNNLNHLNSLDLSFNKLTGKIPQGKVFSNLSIPSLQGNEALCGAPQLGFPPCIQNGSASRAKRGQRLLNSILPGTSCVVLLILALFYLLFAFRGRNKFNTTAQDDDTERFNGYRPVSYYELVRATNNFSEANLLGRGSFGSVFKGCLDNGMFVAVKVLDLEVEGATKSFTVECHALRTARHRNLVKIISVCSNMDFKALVLEFMPNGSLDKWLYSYNNYLNLVQRLDIILDVSAALDYLHQRHPHVIVHCDLKPSNVLLDENMTAHLSDFGIAKLFLGDNKSAASTEALGTIGYMPPEYGFSGKVSREGDVYSFGILLLETFTRKKPIDAMFDVGLDFKQWVNRSYPSSALEIVDCNLLRDDSINNRQPATQVATHHCLLSIIDLGLLCSKDSPNERILMEEVVSRLQKIKVEYLSYISRS